MTILSILNQHANSVPNKTAFIFLKDGEIEEQKLSYKQLRDKSAALGKVLKSKYDPTTRIVIALPEGEDFVTIFLACLFAKLIPVPVKQPLNLMTSQKLTAIFDDCQAHALICDDVSYGKFCQLLTGADVKSRFPQIAPSTLHEAINLLNLKNVDVNLEHDDRQEAVTTAYLQYTSGSTGMPKGVKVSHVNVMANCKMLQNAWRLTGEDRILSWLPMFHDMGLIGSLFEPIYAEATCILMTPKSFVQKPTRWMAAVSKYQATITGGPNFAFRSICSPRIVTQTKDLDLSSLKVMYCGSEPISPKIVDEFLELYGKQGLLRKTFCACYGMAEATVLITMADYEQEPVYAHLPLAGSPELLTLDIKQELTESSKRIVIGCGTDIPGQKISIVKPNSRMLLDDGKVGEIWVSGKHISDGYWENQEATQHAFKAKVLNQDDHEYLRTGDLGFVLNGELFITGRIKELLIFNGTNYYPQDIEDSIVDCHPKLIDGRSVAFSVNESSVESLVIVYELGMEFSQSISGTDCQEITEAINSSIFAHHQLPVKDLVQVPFKAIPRTTSGKICRVSCKKAYLEKSLKPHKLVEIDNLKGVVA